MTIYSSVQIQVVTVFSTGKQLLHFGLIEQWAIKSNRFCSAVSHYAN